MKCFFIARSEGIVCWSNFNFHYKVALVTVVVFKASALWANAFYKSKCLCVCLCVPVCVCSLYEVPFKIFAPTSQSRISNIFGDSESLGKCCGKKWSSDLNIFAQKWSKIAARFFSSFFYFFSFFSHFLGTV